MITVMLRWYPYSTMLGEFKPRDIEPLIELIQEFGMYNEYGNKYTMSNAAIESEMRGGVRITRFIINMVNAEGE